MDKPKLTRNERDKIHLDFFRTYGKKDGFRSCSVRYTSREGHWIKLGVVDLYLDWIPDEFEGIPVWAEEVVPSYSAILTMNG